MIKWLKGYFISSTYAEDIGNQSWGTNHETPCTWEGRTRLPSIQINSLPFGGTFIDRAANSQGPVPVPRRGADREKGGVFAQPV